MRSLGYVELIRGNRNFRNLLAGQFISELGNWFNFIAGLGLVRLVSDASPTAAGIFFVVRLVPFSLMSPIAGTFVDRFSRRQVMIATDVIRGVVATSFLLVTDAKDLWIAYVATLVLHTMGAFFEGAKNASTPNLTGKEGLLAGTALLFSSRFLLMAVGSALGGWASAVFGYKVAFIINAVSFLVSAYTVWLIPEEATRDEATGRRMKKFGRSASVPAELEHADEQLQAEPRPPFLTELKEGIHYAATNHFALTILLMNVIWALGAGAMNIVFERIGGVHFPQTEGWDPDLAVAVLWTATGLGLTAGMLSAHKASQILDRRNWNYGFIGWALILHGVTFAAAGWMPTLFLWALFVFLSRLLVGVEYAVQETAFQRSLPDHIRGRISTLDRGAEMTIFGLVSFFTSEMMYYITPQALTVLSGLISGMAGVVWFVRERRIK
jgi:MFS family permease